MHFILAGHGKQAIEIVNAAEMVFGQMDQIDVVTFLPGENVDNLKKSIGTLLIVIQKQKNTFFSRFVWWQSI